MRGLASSWLCYKSISLLKNNPKHISYQRHSRCTTFAQEAYAQLVLRLYNSGPENIMNSYSLHHDTLTRPRVVFRALKNSLWDLSFKKKKKIQVFFMLLWHLITYSDFALSLCQAWTNCELSMTLHDLTPLLLPEDVCMRDRYSLLQELLTALPVAAGVTWSTLTFPPGRPSCLSLPCRWQTPHLKAQLYQRSPLLWASTLWVLSTT